MEEKNISRTRIYKIYKQEVEKQKEKIKQEKQKEKEIKIPTIKLTL